MIDPRIFFPNGKVRKPCQRSTRRRTSLHVFEHVRATLPLKEYRFNTRNFLQKDARYTPTLNRQLAHGAMRLLDRNVCVRAHAGVGIRDRNPAEALPTDDVRHAIC